ncbi:hypothetical protein J3B02_000007 [Coemansia erecta]|uniref:Chitin-binding type-2 domain-containing protein n=1 Tax=Coemansia asiatica TaxID=1052880 RepID=A0A9W7XM32_9FUNG|nr:hypothetical protein LPJ64_002875 [Coemansia asiatica]KAJ2858628.1 hypothetical protein J3B02_000007 [Coemansia erecta]KAJ2887486.1 hypothetical protein FB639_001278 [Coemansia asiatica]
MIISIKKFNFCISVAALLAANVDLANAQTCSAGSYRCGLPSGQGAVFYQCDVGGTEVQKTCAPGTVCYSQGNTILCSYPVNTSGSQQPASDQLAAGAPCSFSSPFDEYTCPGPSGQYDYYLRCLSGNFVHFPCPPGTACIKNQGQNMFCGWKGQAGSSDVPAASAANATFPAISIIASSSIAFEVPSMPPMASSDEFSITSASSSEATEDISTSSLLWGETTSTDSGFGIGSESATALTSLSSLASSSAFSSSLGGLWSDDPFVSPSSSSGFLISMSIGIEESSTFGGSFTISSGTISVSDTSEIAVGSTISGIAESTGGETSPEVAATATSASEPAAASASSAVNSASPELTASSHGSGLTGPMISSGLEMLLNNGVQLPITLPNIDLPPIDLATVHLPDMTFDGIALTAIPLPSVTVPAFNPASLTKFSYIQELMSKAGITFDDLAKLPLQDLQKLDLSHLDLNNLDINAIMSVVNVNRVSFPSSNMIPTPIIELVSTKATDPALQTTTLDADGIDALLGLSIMTYSTA